MNLDYFPFLPPIYEMHPMSAQKMNNRSTTKPGIFRAFNIWDTYGGKGLWFPETFYSAKWLPGAGLKLLHRVHFPMRSSGRWNELPWVVDDDWSSCMEHIGGLQKSLALTFMGVS